MTRATSNHPLSRQYGRCQRYYDHVDPIFPEWADFIRDKIAEHRIPGEVVRTYLAIEFAVAANADNARDREPLINRLSIGEAISLIRQLTIWSQQPHTYQLDRGL